MLLIDNGIEKMALKLQQRQNLSHIEFLKVRLGMQVVVINSFKAVVTYGLALLLNIFFIHTHCSPYFSCLKGLFTWCTRENFNALSCTKHCFIRCFTMVNSTI